MQRRDFSRKNCELANRKCIHFLFSDSVFFQEICYTYFLKKLIYTNIYYIY